MSSQPYPLCHLPMGSMGLAGPGGGAWSRMALAWAVQSVVPSLVVFTLQPKTTITVTKTPSVSPQEPLQHTILGKLLSQFSPDTATHQLILLMSDSFLMSFCHCSCVSLITLVANSYINIIHHLLHTSSYFANTLVHQLTFIHQLTFTNTLHQLTLFCDFPSKANLFFGFPAGTL